MGNIVTQWVEILKAGLQGYMVVTVSSINHSYRFDLFSSRTTSKLITVSRGMAQSILRPYITWSRYIFTVFPLNIRLEEVLEGFQSKYSIYDFFN